MLHNYAYTLITLRIYVIFLYNLYTTCVRVSYITLWYCICLATLLLFIYYIIEWYVLFYSYKIETVSVNNIFRYIPIYRILLSLDIFIYISPFFNIFVCVTVFKKCRRKEVLSLRKFESSDSSLLSFPSLLLCFTLTCILACYLFLKL